jgi:putative DNA primase/helicase
VETSRRGAESRRQEAEVRLTEGANESARRASSQYVGDRGSGRRLWITDGVKKADSLTSRGACVISFTGVFNWRSQLGTLGDWEDVLLKSRNVVICFDADARTNPNALRAMVRLGRWLKSRDTKKVWYLTVPAEINGKPVKGADDFLAGGGTLEELKAARTTTEPNPDVADDTFTDARLAETIADDVLADRFMWVSRLGWLGWDGRRWAEATDVQVAEAIRQYGLDRFAEAMKDNRNSQGSKETVNGWHSMLGAGRMRSVLALARGIVERKADELDAEPDLLNTPSGVVDLQTGVLSQHNPAWLMTKITSGSFRPGFIPTGTRPSKLCPDQSGSTSRPAPTSRSPATAHRTARCQYCKAQGRTARAC